MISFNDIYSKIKRQYINLSLLNAVSLIQYLIHFPFFFYYYFLGRGEAAFPLNITLDLSYECNLNCKYCFIYFLKHSNFVWDKSSLTYEQIEKLVKTVKNKNTSFFLTGGEITLIKNLIGIIKLIKSHNFRCGIFTNATALTQLIADNLIKYDIDYVYFSLDGPKHIHDKLRANGTFDKIYSNIGYIIKKRNRTKPRVIMNVLILDDNYDKLIEIIDIAHDLKIDGVSFDFLTFLNNKEFNNHKYYCKKYFPDDEFTSLVYVTEIPNREVENLSDIVNNIIEYAKRKGVRIFFKPNLKSLEIKEWFNTDFRFERKCIYPWNVLRISPHGDVYPCAQYYIKMGNIHETSIENIWNGRKFRKFRNLLKTNELLPGCNRCVKL